MATNKEIIYLPLENVDNEHCAMLVEKGLSRVKGIESHKVEVNNSIAASIISDNEMVTNAVKAIVDLCFHLTAAKGTIPVWEMPRASYAASAESVVKFQTEVVNASVNYGT